MSGGVPSVKAAWRDIMDLSDSVIIITRQTAKTQYGQKQHKYSD